MLVTGVGRFSQFLMQKQEGAPGPPGPSGQVQELQDRSGTSRSISRMIRSSSRTTLKMVFLRYKKLLGGYSDPLRASEGPKVTNSSLLVGQTASGPPSYIQVKPPGADFRGPGAQKHQFKDQKQEKRNILSPLSDLLQTL